MPDEWDLASAAADLDPSGVYVGRAHLPASLDPRGIGGPTPVAIRPDGVYDLSGVVPTVSALFERSDRLEVATAPDLRLLGSVDEALAESHHARRDPGGLRFLAPLDLQVIKACGVTFVDSLVERVIEEAAQGEPDRAAAARERLMHVTGTRLVGLRAGSEAALTLLAELRSMGMTSPYLEVGLGTLSEVFTKAPTLAAVGTGARIGIRADSTWNNPEPEIVLAVDSAGSIVAATVGNDVNLRDIEGRSPLLLGIAKDNTGSCAIGPWFRLFDEACTLDALMATEVALEVDGTDGFHVAGANRLAEISRDPRDLVAQASGANHQYPDGFVLFLGTMMVPTADRMGDGRGFTHRVGDRVRISDPLIGSLVNWVDTSDRVPPWTDGIGGLMRNLAARGLLATEDPSRS